MVPMMSRGTRGLRKLFEKDYYPEILKLLTNLPSPQELVILLNLIDIQKIRIWIMGLAESMIHMVVCFLTSNLSFPYLSFPFCKKKI